VADIGVVRGLIELQDDFTSKLGLAETALSNFTKANQESLVAVAGAAGLVTAAFGLAAAAVYNLGQRGADVNDVRETLEHFTGSVDAANTVLDNLRNGVKGTVSDFDLMKDSARLLSANVKLSTDDFGVLGQAAFVLQNRGLGGTKEMLGLVSDALVTGRTRALAMAVGVVDNTNAEEDYAKSLGVTKDQLSDAGKAEAKRLEVMRLLNAAVKDAGVQELDFGEKIEKAKASVQNYVDGLASAVAKSPALAAGFEVVKNAIAEAFGGSQQGAIDTTLGLIKKGVIAAVDFGIGMVEMARVVNAVWSGIKTVILGVETVAVGIGEAVVGTVALVLGAAASLPGASEGLKLVAAEAKSTADNLHEMTNSLAAQTAEAARGVTGHSEFDKTLDKLGGTLFRVRDAVDAADASQKKNNETADVAASNAQKIARVQEQLKQSMIDRQKVEDELWKVEKKSLEETTQLWDQYFAERSKNTGTSFDEQKAAIQAWADNEVSKLDDSDKNWQQHYDAIQAVAQEKMKGVMMTWNEVRDKSIEGLEQQRDAAVNTYDQMLAGGLHFSRDVLDAQRAKIEDLKDAARGLGEEYKKAHELAAAEAEKQKKELDAVELAARKAAQAARELSASFDVTSANIQQVASQMRLDVNRVMGLAGKGFSFSEILAILSGQLAETSQPRGPRIQGFAEGGIVDVMVGEHGPEVARVPLGTAVYPTGTRPPSAGGGGDTHVWHVNGDGDAVARRVKQMLMTEVKLRRRAGLA
jgi:hypothetical protein